MSDKIIIKDALHVFEKIRQHGIQTSDGYQLNGITALTSHDGYTISLMNDYVTLTIFFHNKFSFEGSNQKEKYTFLEKLENIKKAPI
ncbi:MAG: DUF3081 family protein [Arenicella sp.]